MNSRRDDLQILGTAQSKYANSKKVDIKFPEGITRNDERDYEYNVSNRPSFKDNYKDKDGQLSDIEIEMFYKIMNMDSSVKKDITD